MFRTGLVAFDIQLITLFDVVPTDEEQHDVEAEAEDARAVVCRGDREEGDQRQRCGDTCDDITGSQARWIGFADALSPKSL